MTKYIRVIEKIDGIDKKIILRFNKCNDCTLMTFNKKDFSVSCRKFDNGNDKIINNFVLDIDDNGPIEDISVPKWCGLPNDIYDLNDYKETYLIKDNKIMVSTTGNTEKNLPIYDISYFNKIHKIKNMNGLNHVVPFTVVSNNFNQKKFDNENPFDLDYDRIINNGDNKKLKLREVEEEEDDEDELIFNARNNIRQLPKLKEEEEEEDDIYPIRINTPPLLVCSSCGGYSLSVDRCVNNGMCTDCYDTYQNDSIKMKQTFITNFRLKRGSFFVSRNFKSVE